MVKKEFIKTTSIGYITLIIGSVVMGVRHLSDFFDLLGFVLLAASSIGLFMLYTIWHIHIKQPNKVCITSIIHLAISTGIFIVAAWLKITFICVVGGFFIAYHVIALIVGACLAIARYVEDIEYKHDHTWEDEDTIKNSNEIKLR